MLRASAFVLALLLSTSPWLPARGAAGPRPQTIETIIKAYEAGKEAAVAHASHAYKPDAQPQNAHWEAAVKRAAGLTSDLESIVSSISKMVTKAALAGSASMAAICPWTGLCKEDHKQDGKSAPGKDEHHKRSGSS